MDILDLTQTLKKFGMRKLTELVGEERLQAIDEVISPSITESALVKMLFLRNGSQILAQKSVRKMIFSALSEDYLGFIIDGNYIKNRAISISEKKSLDNLAWGRNIRSTKRLLEIFDLSEDYLPPIYQQHPDHEKITPESLLFPYQRRVKDRFVRNLIGGDDRILIHMPTGAGKTRTCIEGLVDYWRSSARRDGFIVWLAHSEELCEQAYQSFLKLWKERGDSTIDMYRLWGPHKIEDVNENSSGIIVASLQKLHSMRTTSSNAVFKSIAVIKSKCRMIVIDEAHKAIAPTYKSSIEFISNIDATKIIGLTATPGRGIDTDETTELVEFFHKNKITITSELGEDVPDPMSYLQDNEYLAKIIRKPVFTDINIDLNDTERTFVANFLELPASVLNKLADDAQRNALIISEIYALYSKDKHIIVFALSVEHAHLITELLALKGVDARCIDGSTSAYDRRKYIEDYKKSKISVLVNYGVLTTGFDAPNTNAVVITRPTGSLVLYSQMIGRGIRGLKVGGNKECILVDLKDNLIGFPDENWAFSYFDTDWKNN